MRKFLLLFAVLAFACQGWAEEPIQVDGKVGTFIKLPCPDKCCKQVLWTSIDEGLSIFPPDQLKDPCLGVAIVTEPGVYRALCVGLTEKGVLAQHMFEVNVLQPVKKAKKQYGPLQGATVAETPSGPPVVSAPVFSPPPVQFAPMMAPPMMAPPMMAAPMPMMGGFSGGSCSSCR